MRARVVRFAVTVAFSVTPALAADYDWPVIRVVDGDTVAVDAGADMPPELAAIRVRLRGVDTPENGHRARCEAERAAGQAATAFTTDALCGAGSVVVRDPAWGTWGGRVVAGSIVDGKSLAETPVATGHGKPYDGRKRGDWCERIHGEDDG